MGEGQSGPGDPPKDWGFPATKWDGRYLEKAQALLHPYISVCTIHMYHPEPLAKSPGQPHG